MYVHKIAEGRAKKTNMGQHFGLKIIEIANDSLLNSKKGKGAADEVAGSTNSLVVEIIRRQTERKLVFSECSKKKGGT